MNRTVLYDLQRDNGASFTNVGEWELPVDYGDCLVEHHAVRHGVGLIDRSSRGTLLLSGPDRFTWLQGMVSSDVRRLADGESVQLSCLLNATGHLLADLRIVHRDDTLLLDVPREVTSTVLETLGRYVISEDVELSDATPRIACLSLQGPAATEEWVRDAVGAAAFAVPADHTGEGGFDLYLDAAQCNALWTRLTAAGAHPVGEAAAETLRIEAGIPRFGIDMTEETIPLECGLAESHISFTKGCYVGQEIIARIHARGHTNRTLTGLLLEGSSLAAQGDRIYPTDGDATREIGWATSATHSPSLERSIALGYVRNETRESGMPVRILRAEEEDAVRAEIVPLPFYRRG